MGRMVSRRGSMEPGTLDGRSRSGVSFGLKGPTGGRLVSVALEKSATGMVLGNVNEKAKGKERGGVFICEFKAGSEAAAKGVLLGDRLHMINGSVLPLSLGHRGVGQRLRGAKRPVHVIFERAQQEEAYMTPTAAVMAEAALEAAMDDERDAMADIKALVAANKPEAVATWEGPISGWKGVVVEEVATEGGLNGGSREAVVELDLSHMNLVAELVALRPFLLALPFLRSVALSGNEGLSGDLAALAGHDDQSGSMVTPALRVLYMTNCTGVFGDIACFAACSATLATLNIDNCRGATGDVKKLKAACPKLRVLSVIGTGAK